MNKPAYLNWIIEEEGTIDSYDGKIKCYRIDCVDDISVLDDWALHIRKHYIPDDELKESCDILDISPEEYLKKYIIPQKSEGLGPTSRANVISEILFSDLLEYIFGYHVPRCRQYNMSGKTVSEHGTDVLGYKFANEDKAPSNQDRVVAAEVKAVLSKSDTGVVANAIKDSKKDEFRVSLTLDFMRKKLRNMGRLAEADEITRFQMKTRSGYDYLIDYIAAGITALPSLETVVNSGIEVRIIPGVDGSDLMIGDNRTVFFVHGKKLMELTHKVFERCVS